MFVNEAEKPGEDVRPENEDKTDKAEAKAEELKDQEDKADPPPADEENVEKKTNPFETRIKELTDKVRTNKIASDTQILEAKAENERLLKELDSRPEVQEPLKTLEDFDLDDAKYLAYLDERSTRIATKAAERVASKVQIHVSAKQVEDQFSSRENTFSATVDDYQDVVYGETGGQRKWQASASVADELRFSEIGPEMAYHLAKNPDIASEISSLSPRETVRRMTLLEADLKAEIAKTSRKVSKAPPPPPKIKAGDAGLEKGYREGMSDAEFAKLRRKEIANR